MLSSVWKNKHESKLEFLDLARDSIFDLQYDNSVEKPPVVALGAAVEMAFGVSRLGLSSLRYRRNQVLGKD